MEQAADGLAAMAVRRPRRQDRPGVLRDPIVAVQRGDAPGPAPQRGPRHRAGGGDRGDLHGLRRGHRRGRVRRAGDRPRRRRAAARPAAAPAALQPGRRTAARGDELDRVVAVADELAARHQPISLRLGRGRPLRPGRGRVARPGDAGTAALDPLQRDTDRGAAGRTAGRRAFGERSDPRPGWPTARSPPGWPSRSCARCSGPCATATSRSSARIDALAVILVGGRGDTAHLPLG